MLNLEYLSITGIPLKWKMNITSLDDPDNPTVSETTSVDQNFTHIFKEVRYGIIMDCLSLKNHCNLLYRLASTKLSSVVTTQYRIG